MGGAVPRAPLVLPDVPPWTEAERLAKEKEVLGFFISGHPLGRYRDEVERICKNFRFVAETYGLVIPLPNARRALADLSILLGMWASARHGVDDMYGSENRRRLKLPATLRAWRRTAARRRAHDA